MIEKVVDIEAQQKKLIQKIDSKDAVKVRESVYARLRVEEGMTQREAYIESHSPSTDNEQSIDSMACRVEKKPRVLAEMDRIRARLRDEEMGENLQVTEVLEGNKARTRIALEIMAIALRDDVSTKDKLVALRMAGNLKHVDAFIGNTASQMADAQTKANNAGEARAALQKVIMKAMGGNASMVTIDTQREEE